MSFRKNPYPQKKHPLPPNFSFALTEFFQPTFNKRQSVIAGGAGSESQECQRFLLGIVSSSILWNFSGNSELHAGTTSECVRVKCGSLLDFDLACCVLPIQHFHPGKHCRDEDSQRCRVVHDFADLSKAGDSQPGTC